MAESTAQESSERRRSSRVDLDVPVVATADDGKLELISRDVSTGGMRLETPGDAPAIGRRFQLSFRLPEVPNPVEISAEVRWIDRSDPQFFGVQFTIGLRAVEVWAINRLRYRRV